MGKIHDRLRKNRHDDGGADQGPIEQEFIQQMNELASLIDQYFNGPNCKSEDRQIGFFLATYKFGEEGRLNYIGNGRRDDVKATLKDILARLEGRHAPETTTIN